MAFVTASSAARSREVLCGGAAPHDDNTTETATARSGRWKVNMSAPGQDLRSLPARAVPHKTKTLRSLSGFGVLPPPPPPARRDTSRILEMSGEGQEPLS